MTESQFHPGQIVSHYRIVENRVRSLIERYHNAGVRNISHQFYEGGRHEMLNELNRSEVRANLLAWITATLKEEVHHRRLNSGI